MPGISRLVRKESAGAYQGLVTSEVAQDSKKAGYARGIGHGQLSPQLPGRNAVGGEQKGLLVFLRSEKTGGGRENGNICWPAHQLSKERGVEIQKRFARARHPVGRRE